MRVANVMLEARVGGPQLRIATVAHELAKRGIETVVILPRDVENDGRQFKDMLDRLGVAYRAAPLHRMTVQEGAARAAGFVAGFIPEVIGLAKLLRDERIDLVHANGLHQPHGPVAGSLAGCAVAWHLNDCSVPLPISRPMAALAWRIADVLPVSVEAAGRYHFPKRYVRSERFPILHAPFDATRFSPDGPKAETPAGRRIVLTTGNLNPLKGADILVRAAARVLARHPDVEIWVAGERLSTQVTFWTRVEQLVEGVVPAGRVKLLGRRNDIASLLRAADVYVCASRMEACPISVLEAMATGRPLVATAVGGVPELIRDGVDGVLVPPEDPDAMGDGIIRLLDDTSGAAAMGRSAHARASTEFTLDQAVEAHVVAYTEALRRHSSCRTR